MGFPKKKYSSKDNIGTLEEYIHQQTYETLPSCQDKYNFNSWYNSVVL